MTAPDFVTDPVVTAPPPLPRLVKHQFRYDLRCFWRNSQSRFSTLALPVLFLVIFGSIFTNDDVKVPGGRINESVYYVPNIIVFGILAAAFMNLTVTVVRNRESGIYKRRRATPLPASALIAARALVGVLTALAITVVLLALGWAAFGASLPTRTAPAFVVDIVVGAAVFCCLGFAALLRHRQCRRRSTRRASDRAPLCFISGVFIPAGELPNWLVKIGDVFPIRHLASALLAAYNPHTTGSGFRWGDLAVLAAWGAAGLLFAIRRFRWLPRGV